VASTSNNESLSLDQSVYSLLKGRLAKDVVEAIDGTATSYAAALMGAGYSEAAAIKKAVKLLGHEPDDEILYMATKNHGAAKKSSLRHWLKQGHYDPTKTPDYLDPAGNSL